MIDNDLFPFITPYDRATEPSGKIIARTYNDDFFNLEDIYMRVPMLCGDIEIVPPEISLEYIILTTLCHYVYK